MIFIDKDICFSPILITGYKKLVNRFHICEGCSPKCLDPPWLHPRSAQGPPEPHLEAGVGAYNVPRTTPGAFTSQICVLLYHLSSLPRPWLVFITLSCLESIKLVFLSFNFPTLLFSFDHIYVLSGQVIALQKRKSLAEVRRFNQSFSRQHEQSANIELGKIKCHSDGNR